MGGGRRAGGGGEGVPDFGDELVYTWERNDNLTALLSPLSHCSASSCPTVRPVRKGLRWGKLNANRD